MSNFKLNINPIKDFVKQLNKKLNNTDTLFAKIGKQITKSTIKRFTDETAPDGSKWEKSKRALKDNRSTLVKTGALKSSIEFETTKRLLAIGSPYNHYDVNIHQKGGYAGKKKIPARPFIGFSRKDEKKIKDMFEDYLK